MKNRLVSIATTAPLLTLSCCAAIVTATCSSDSEGVDKQGVLSDLASVVILPTLDDVVARTDAFAIAVEQFATAPSQGTLDAAQDAWRAARVPWKEAEAFAFGPTMNLRIASAMDQFPVDTAKIDMEIAGTTRVTDSYVESLGANGKGLHAIEYLLFREDDDAAVLVSFTADPSAERRGELLIAFANDVHERATQLQRAWATTGGNYITQLTEPGASNTAFPTIKDSIDILVNESVFLSELVADNKIGRPSGTASGGTPQPELQESGPSDNSIADMTSNLRSIRNVYFGTRDGTIDGGIHSLVADKSRETDQAVRDALDEAIASVNAIPRPYRSALTDQAPEVEAAHEAVKTLKRVLTTEVVALLGVTLTFHDNDGD